jgi:micrococcal nuclease
VAPASAFTARVDRVVDGDTFIAVRRGERLRVRLIGVDAPETVKPGAPVGCWGPQASRLLHRLLPPGTVVHAAYQPGGHLDRYRRELWDVWLPGGRFLQAVLARRGAATAVAYRPQVAHAALLDRLAGVARQHHRGLWGSCARAPPAPAPT